jgi:hypothetical protein
MVRAIIIILALIGVLALAGIPEAGWAQLAIALGGLVVVLVIHWVTWHPGREKPNPPFKVFQKNGDA